MAPDHNKPANHMDLTRRGFLAGAAGAAFLLACGSDSDDSASEAVTSRATATQNPHRERRMQFG